MVTIRPMGEDFILPRCLHQGPIDPEEIRRDWQSVPDLPSHPWQDGVIADLVGRYDYLSQSGGHDAMREFMREIIRRYGTCALLAWDEDKVTGFIRFYPLDVARMMGAAVPEKKHLAVVFAGPHRFPPDPEALWVQCVMTCRPYIGEKPATAGPHHFPGSSEAGARRGVGQQLVHALIDWARPRGWKRIVKQAHPDLDVYYGIFGGGGRAFWEKAGFRVIETFRDPSALGECRTLIDAERQEKGIGEEEAETWFLMSYDLTA